MTKLKVRLKTREWLSGGAIPGSFVELSSLPEGHWFVLPLGANHIGVVIAGRGFMPNGMVGYPQYGFWAPHRMTVYPIKRLSLQESCR